MKKKFDLLPYHEEKKLSREQLEKYYEELRNALIKRKMKVTTPGALSIAPKLKGITGKIAERVSTVLAGGKMEVVCDGIENIPTGLYRLSYVSSLNSGYGREYLPVEVEVYLHNRSGKDSTGYFAPLE